MIINNLVGIFTFLRGLDITKQKMMKRLQRSFSKSKKNSVVSNDKKNIEIDGKNISDKDDNIFQFYLNKESLISFNISPSKNAISLNVEIG